MTAKEMIRFLHLAEGLKRRTRHSVTLEGREESVAEHRERESEAIREIVELLPDGERERFSALYREMGAMETGEARLCKALDRCEALLQHNEAPLSSWLELEYELQMTYGQGECEAFPFTRELREALRIDSVRKIESERTG